MKYEVGDCVTIRNIAWYNERRNVVSGIDYAFSDDMSVYCGLTKEIHYINENKIYLKETNGYVFHEWMFEPKDGGIIETKIDLSKNAIIDPPVRCWCEALQYNGWIEFDLVAINHNLKQPFICINKDVVECLTNISLEDPNIPKESYIPYTYEDFPEFRGLWVRNKESYAQSIIDSLNYNFIFLANSGIGISYEDAFKDLEIVNSDRTTRPFGKKVE